MKNELLKKVTAGIFILFSVFCASCNNKQKAEFMPEPADPDSYDMSVWENIKPGLHSGFGSIEAAAAKERPDRFLNSINTKTLDSRSSADVINEGKQLVREIAGSDYQDRPDRAAPLSKVQGLPFMGNRFFTFSTVVRVNQIETTRDGSDGADEWAFIKHRYPELIRGDYRKQREERHAPLTTGSRR